MPKDGKKKESGFMKVGRKAHELLTGAPIGPPKKMVDALHKHVPSPTTGKKLKSDPNVSRHKKEATRRNK